MEAYPLRMRQRIIALYELGRQTGEIAEALGTCRSGTRRVRVMLVRAPDSSRNTRRRGSTPASCPCQAARRSATSGRCCSAACSDFF